MAKKISTEELADMVEKGFDQLSEEMRELRKHVDRHLDGVELKISSYATSSNQNFERQHEWTKEHEERISALEKRKR